MSPQDFTTGPWELDESGKYYAPNVIRHNGVIVCKMLTSGGTINYSDARLIAQAPALVAALAACVASLSAMEIIHGGLSPAASDARSEARAVLAAVAGKAAQP